MADEQGRLSLCSVRPDSIATERAEQAVADQRVAAPQLKFFVNVPNFPTKRGGVTRSA